jgi:hypothetical protein
MDGADADRDRDHTDALLAAAGRGDLDAFAAFYDRTAPAVFELMCRALRRSLQAERATQDVYLQLWRDAPAFGSTGRSAWSMVMSEVHRALAGATHELVTLPAQGRFMRKVTGTHAPEVGTPISPAGPRESGGPTPSGGAA